MRPFRHSGDSANIAFYGEDAPQSSHRLWCEVLRSDITKVGGEWRRKPIPDFYVRVHRGANEVASFTYTPKTRPAAGPLPARTVARLVRANL